MKIGFFGGSFNPPTNAHMNLANKVLNECNLDKVIFVPMGDFYEKSCLVKAEFRLKMLKIACSEFNDFEVSDLEVRARKRLNTIDAFRLIELKYPNDDKYFIMGADNFIKVEGWKESKELIDRYSYIVIERENINLSEYIKRYKTIKIQVVKNDKYKKSSATQFRKLLNGKLENQDIISDRVLQFIMKNKIY